MCSVVLPELKYDQTISLESTCALETKEHKQMKTKPLELLDPLLPCLSKNGLKRVATCLFVSVIHPMTEKQTEDRKRKLAGKTKQRTTGLRVCKKMTNLPLKSNELLS